MRQEQFPEFRELLGGTLSFYRQDVTQFMLDVWWQACRGYDLEQVRKAMTAHAMDPDRGQFAPKPADIVRKLGGTSTDRAMLAWGKVMDAMQTVGAYTDVVFDDPAIHACVQDLGGWPKMCRTSMDELGYLQHRFCESHRAYASRESFEYPRALIGDRSPDEMYVKRGLPAPRPTLVGDASRAKRVYELGGASVAKPLARLALDAIEHGPKLIQEQRAKAA